MSDLVTPSAAAPPPIPPAPVPPGPVPPPMPSPVPSPPLGATLPPPAPGSGPVPGPPPPTMAPPAPAPTAIVPVVGGPPPPPAPPPVPPRPPRPRPERTGRGPAVPPPGGARVAIVAGSVVLTALTLAWATFSLVNAMSHTSEVQTVAFGPGIRSVVVRVDEGSVSVRARSRDDVGGSRTIERGLQIPDVRERVDGDTLRIDASCGATTSGWCDVAYALEVPTDTRVDVESVTGSLTVAGVTGGVRAHSTMGNVDATDVAGSAVLETTVGSVWGTALRSADVQATTTGGSVRLQFEEPPSRVVAHAGTGSVDVALPRGDAAYHVVNPTNRPNQTQVAVATDDGSDRVVDVASRGGSIRVHYR